ncbi:MAG: cell division protein FtsZ [Saprospiraceae bacterium]|nr:cell division protein FtsZ [Saprospiraceae bacterium]
MLFEIPKEEESIIKVIGVGGGGSNAVTHMFSQGIVGVDFAICNTDNQALEISTVPTKIQLGPELTEGRGAGSKPIVGRQACIESIEDVKSFLSGNTKMLFVTAGMGGGTGTGAAPIIAKAAQDLDILTVGIVTMPFTFEGRRRTSQGVEGLDDLKKNVDTLIIISNDKLRQIHGNLKISEAFAKADNILTTAAKGIAEIITVPGYVNVDFEDVNTVMRGSGVAIMGTSYAEGEDRARRAVDEALNSPLLEDNDIRGAQHILLNITSGTKEITMDEIFEITEFVQEEAGFGTDLIWGNCYDENLGDSIAVTIIATGFDEENTEGAASDGARVVVDLDEHGTKEIKVEVEKVEVERTVEFNDVRQKMEHYRRRHYSYDEPYMKEEEKKRLEEERRKFLQQEESRREVLRTNAKSWNTPQQLSELENVPAYMRRNVELKEVTESTESELSNWSVSTGSDGELETENTFLHRDVD